MLRVLRLIRQGSAEPHAGRGGTPTTHGVDPRARTGERMRPAPIVEAAAKPKVS